MVENQMKSQFLDYSRVDFFITQGNEAFKDFCKPPKNSGALSVSLRLFYVRPGVIKTRTEPDIYYVGLNEHLITVFQFFKVNF